MGERSPRVVPIDAATEAAAAAPAPSAEDRGLARMAREDLIKALRTPRQHQGLLRRLRAEVGIVPLLPKEVNSKVAADIEVCKPKMEALYACVMAWTEKAASDDVDADAAAAAWKDAKGPARVAALDDAVKLLESKGEKRLTVHLVDDAAIAATAQTDKAIFKCFYKAVKKWIAEAKKEVAKAYLGESPAPWLDHFGVEAEERASPRASAAVTASADDIRDDLLRLAGHLAAIAAGSNDDVGAALAPAALENLRRLSAAVEPTAAEARRRMAGSLSITVNATAGVGVTRTHERRL